MPVKVIHGDCLAILPTLEAESVHAVVCDPPYHLTSIVKRFGAKNSAPAQFGKDGAFSRASRGFMGQQWDGGDIASCPETWAAVLRVLKPGAHLLAFGGTRTYHRMACAIEDAGFEIRDCLFFLYGTGFPKSHDVSKAIDKAAGAEREVVGVKPGHEEFVRRTDRHSAGGRREGWDRPWRDDPEMVQASHLATAPATPEAAQWAGWGTALKPASEPILLCSKPLTVAQFFGIILECLSEELVGCLGLLASDAERRLSGIRVKLSGAGVSSVLESVKTSVWANFGNVPFVAQAFTSRGRALGDQIKIRGSSVPFAVRQNGSQGGIAETQIHAGAGEAISTRIADISTSVTMGGISENIVSSWLDISDAILTEANRFTTETAIRLTIGLRTWRSCLLQSISAGTGSSSPEFSPNVEPIILARKPLHGTVAANVLAHGCGAINVDACRVAATDSQLAEKYASVRNAPVRANAIYGEDKRARSDGNLEPHPAGRWPSNLAHDGSDEVEQAFARFGERTSGPLKPYLEQHRNASSFQMNRDKTFTKDADSGSASRFFFCGKATAEDRANSKHPTVKPLALMDWLVKLVTPTNGTVLDPFAGSGTTLLAADRLGMNAIGIEQSAEYVADIHRRLAEDAPLLAEPIVTKTADDAQLSLLDAAE